MVYILKLIFVSHKNIFCIMNVMKIHKDMDNLEIAQLLRDVAASLKIKGNDKNRFRIVAYERAADAVEHLSSEAKDLWDEKKLEEVGGIGTNIASHLGDIFKTGKSKHFSSILKGMPPSMFELMKVSGIGPKRAYDIATKFKLGKNPVKDLERLIKEGKIAKLEGFGEQTEESLEKSLQEVAKKTGEKRHLLPYAEQIAGEVIDWMKKDPSVLKIEALGSLRRKVSTIGDIDIAVSTKNPKKVLDHFVSYKNSKRTLERGDKKASIILPGNVQIDLMVTDPSSWGSLLQHFTGSKHHNIALRDLARRKNLSLSEYGIKKLGSNGKNIKKFETEEAFYKYLGLEYIPPEIREDTGEIEKAKEGKLPNLVELKDIKGDFQIHSSFDIETSHDLGLSSMEEIIKKAEELKYEYIAFTEHNPSKSKHTDTQIIKLLEKKKKKVDELNEKLKKSSGTMKKVFNSLEIDIMPDGDIPVPKEGFEFLDFALMSVHSSFTKSKESQTERILKAFSNHPKIKIFAHPTARKLNARESIEANWTKIFEYASKNNKLLEISAEPMRLDLPDYLIQEAIERKVFLSLGTDAHHESHMDNMKFGVANARRGWAENKNIINTYPLSDVEKILLAK